MNGEQNFILGVLPFALGIHSGRAHKIQPAQNMETAWNVARQGGYEDVSLLATQEFEQIFVLKK